MELIECSCKCAAIMLERDMFSRVMHNHKMTDRFHFADESNLQFHCELQNNNTN